MFHLQKPWCGPAFSAWSPYPSSSKVLPHRCILWTSLLDNLPIGSRSEAAPSTAPWNPLCSPPVRSKPSDKPLPAFLPLRDGWRIPWLLWPCSVHCTAIPYGQRPCCSASPSVQIPYYSLRKLSWMQMDCFPAGGNRSLSHAPPGTFFCVLFQAVHIPISTLKWWHRGHPASVKTGTKKILFFSVHILSNPYWFLKYRIVYYY